MKKLIILILTLIFISQGYTGPIKGDSLAELPIIIQFTEKAGFYDYLYYAGGIIEVSSGNLIYSETDHGVNLCDEPFDIIRTYNSITYKNLYSFGYGWSSILDIRLIDWGSGKIFLREDGSMVRISIVDNKLVPPVDSNITIKTVGNLTKIILKDKDYIFDEKGLPVSLYEYKDYNTRKIDFETSNGNVSKISFNNTDVFTIKRSENGLVESIKDPLGIKTSYSYNDAYLTSMESRNGTTTIYKYDDMGRMREKKKNIDTFSTEYTYDDLGRIESVSLSGVNSIPLLRMEYDDKSASIIDYSGSTIEIDMDNKGRPITILDQYYIPTTLEYTDLNKISSIKDPEGSATKYEYDSFGNLIKMIDPSGGVEAFEWTEIDGRWFLATSINELGGKTTIKRNDSGLIEEITDPVGNRWKNKYENLLLIETADPLGDLTKYSYDSLGNISSITLPTGDKTLIQHDRCGRIILEVDPKGNRTSYTYNKLGKLLSITDGLGQITKMKYDEWGNLVETVYPDNTKEETKYNIYGQVIDNKDASGETFFDYDTEGNMVKLIDKRGNTTKHTVDEKGRITEIFDDEGTIESYKYDSLGRVVEKVNQFGGVFTYQYDPLGRLIKEVDPFGVEKTYEYDKAGNLLKYKVDGVLIKSFEYDLMSRVVKEKDGPDGVYLFSYDPLGRLKSVKDPLGNIETYEYDSVGNLIKQRDSLGNCKTYKWSCCDELTEVQDPEGNVRKYSYDKLHRLKSVIDEAGFETEFFYDERGRISKVKFPNGSEIEVDYDSSGRPVSLIDQRNGRWSFEYDANGNRTKIVNPEGSVWKYSYDHRNRLVSVINPLGGETKYEYPDPLTRRVIDPDGIVYSSGYDLLGRIVWQKVGKSTYRTAVYDRMGQVASVKIEGVTSNFSYDQKGKLIRSEVGDIITDIFYDDIDRVKSIKTGNNVKYYNYEKGRLSPSEIVDAEGNRTRLWYDSNDNLVAIRNPDGSITRIYRDKRGLISAIIKPGQGVTEYEYDSMGYLIKSINGAGEVVKYTRDSSSKVVKVESDDVNYELSYNLLGLLTDVRNLKDGRYKNTRYEYSPMMEVVRIEEVFDGFKATLLKDYYPSGRLKTIAYPDNTTVKYNYGENGQLSKIDLPSGSVEYEYNDKLVRTGIKLPDGWVKTSILNNDGLPSSIKWKSNDSTLSYGFEYDETGKLIKKETPQGIENFTYTNTGMLKSWKTPLDSGNLTYKKGIPISKNDKDIVRSDGKPIAIGDTHFSYDSNGNLTDITDNRTNLEISYDGLGRMREVKKNKNTIKCERDFIGNITVLGDDFFLGEAFNNLTHFDRDGDVINNYVYDDSGRPIASMGKKTFFILDDGLGNTSYTVDESGNLSDPILYNPFGEHKTSLGYDMPFRWKGYFHYDNIGMTDLGIREYMPQFGLFTSFDPGYPFISFNNPYAFSGWEPVNNDELLGLKGFDCSTEEGLEEFKKIFNEISKTRLYLRYRCIIIGNCNISQECFNKAYWEEYYKKKEKMESSLSSYQTSVRLLEREKSKKIGELLERADFLDKLLRELSYEQTRVQMSVLFLPTKLATDFLFGSIDGLAGDLIDLYGDVQTGKEMLEKLLKGELGEAAKTAIVSKIPYLGDLLDAIDNIRKDEKLAKLIGEIRPEALGLRREAERIEKEYDEKIKKLHPLPQINPWVLLCREFNKVCENTRCRCGNKGPKIGHRPMPGFGPQWKRTPGWLRRDEPPITPGQEGSDYTEPTHIERGKIIEKVVASDGVYLRIKTTSGKVLVVKITSKTKILDEKGREIIPCKLKPGDRISVTGKKLSDDIPCADIMEPEVIRKISEPRREPGHETAPVEPKRDEPQLPPDPEIPREPPEEELIPPWIGEPPPPWVPISPPGKPPTVVPKYCEKGKEKYCYDCIWEMYHKDRWNTGISNEITAGAYKEMELKWSFDTGSSIKSSPVMWQNKIVVSSENAVFCLDGVAGKEIWKFDIDSNGFTPAIDKNTSQVYVATAGGELYSIDFTTGKGNWSLKFGKPASDAPTIFNNTIYAGAGQKLYAVSNFGKILWSKNLGSKTVSVPAILSTDRGVVVSSLSGKLYAFGTNGKTLWNVDLEETPNSPVCSFGKVFITTGKNKLICLSDLDGSELWRISESVKLENPVAIISKKQIVYIAGDKIKIVDADSGNIISKQSIGSSNPGLTGTWSREKKGEFILASFSPSCTSRIHLIGNGEITDKLNKCENGLDEPTYRNAAFCDGGMVFGCPDGRVFYYVKKTEVQIKKTVIELFIGNATAYINGDTYTLDSAPYIKPPGRTMVPLRFISEGLGATVDYTPKKGKVKEVYIFFKGKKITLYIGKNMALVGDSKVYLDAPLEIQPPGRTFVPIRFIAETFGADVGWNPILRKVTIILEED